MRKVFRRVSSSSEMKKKDSPLILVFVYIWIVYVRGRQQYSSSGDVEYGVRVLNITDCPETSDKPLISDVKWTTHGHTQYMSMTGTVPKSVELGRMRVRIEKCLGYQHACEYFQEWNFNSYCSTILMKNQMWTPMVDSITPKTWQKTCPYVEKGIYQVTNASIDISAALRFYKEGSKYHWRGKNYVYNKKNELLACVFAEGHPIVYTKRQRASRSVSLMLPQD